MIEVGRLCVKIAGRDAGKKCVIVEVMDDNYVMIDGQTRRRKCNIKHIEPLKDVIKLSSDINADFKKLGIEIVETKKKESSQKPKKARKQKAGSKLK